MEPRSDEEASMAHMRVSVFKLKGDISPSQVQQMMDSVRNNLLPIITSQPGFVSYQGFQTDEHTVVAVTTWQTRQQGEAQRGPSLQWIQQYLAQAIESFETYAGDVEVSA